MPKAQSDIGLIGLAVMGQNLALNIADHGFQISVYNRTVEKTEKFVAENPATPGGLVGAKLLWVAEHLGEEPFRDLLFSRGGMSWFGGLLGGAVSILSKKEFNAPSSSPALNSSPCPAPSPSGWR